MRTSCCFTVFGQLALVTVAASLLVAPVRAAEPTVVAAMGVDSYSDLKKQLGWLGNQVGSPQLPALAESFVLMATQFKGLAGLDMNRPLGIVVTANPDNENEPVARAYVPVKDLGKLLDVLKGVTGPVQEVGKKRLVTLPSGMRVEISEQNGWAILSQPDSAAGAAAPEEIIAQIVKDFTIGVRLFPAAMPEGMRAAVRQMAEQAADNAANQGQQVDPAALALGLKSLETVESLTFGVAIDEPGDQVFLETRTVMVPGSPAAEGWTAASKSDDGLGLPAAADGKPAAVRAHFTQDITPATRLAVEATLVQLLPAGSGDPITDSLFGLTQDIAGAMLDAEGIDAGLIVDASKADAASPLPALTLSARIKDGPALEKQVKNRLGKEGALPPQAEIAFDTGKESGANLHEIKIDISGMPQSEQLGKSLTATLAVAADRAYLMLGGDASKQVAAAAAAGKKPAAESKPLAGIELSVASLMGYAARMSAAFYPEDPTGDVLKQVAEAATDKPSTLVQLLVQPIERGGSLRLSVDSGALQSLASAVTATQTGATLPGGGIPLPGGAGVPALAP